MGQSKKNKRTQAELPSEPEKVVSPIRVVIASVLCIAITGLLIWLLSLLGSKLFEPRQVMSKKSETPSNVRLPQKGDAASLMQTLRTNVSEFSLEHYTATGSAARSVIDTLQDLQQSEFGIEDYFCDVFCK